MDAKIHWLFFAARMLDDVKKLDNNYEAPTTYEINSLAKIHTSCYNTV
ncbi:MAG TPA: hypothetical protein PKZ58_07190 [Bacillota bacterium]|nr:hypothetical protein [Bacillota bacterium]